MHNNMIKKNSTKLTKKDLSEVSGGRLVARDKNDPTQYDILKLLDEIFKEQQPDLKQIGNVVKDLFK